MAATVASRNGSETTRLCSGGSRHTDETNQDKEVMVPKIHPRTKIENKAKIELGVFLQELRKKHDLTDVEYMRLVANELSGALTGVLKYQLRFERHGNYDDPADWE